MIRKHSRSETRSAFTLVELIVVLLIILILVSLLGSAVMKAMDKIPEVTTRTEIAEMGVALQAFMSDYNLTTPPPSTLVLSEIAPLSTTSSTFLQQVFGRTLGSGQAFVDWNGNGQPDVTPWFLEGEQCLVFYLGGIPTAPGLNLVGAFAPQGFSTNNMNPSQPGGKRKGPYYNFLTARLVSMQAINPVTTMPNGPLSPFHPVYIDAWQVKSTLLGITVPPLPLHVAPMANGIPYAYFSSQGINNQYTADCSSLGAAPYALTGVLPIQYTYPNTYQIISAGKNGTFGSAATGTPGWIPANGAVGAGADDQANFSGGLLGSGQQ